MRPTLALPRYTRRYLAILVVALAVAAMLVPTGGPVVAQGTLTLADFDAAGKEVVLLALVNAFDLANSSGTVYQAAPRSPTVGSLVAGELGIGPNNVPVTLIRLNTNSIQVNHSTEGFLLREYFRDDGAGSDLTGHFQTSDGSATFSLGGENNGSKYAVFDFPASQSALIDGTGTGDLFILAFYRNIPAPAPPAQVSGVRAAALSDTEVSVSWSAAANADGYVVQWATVGQSFDTAREASVAGTSHTITGLEPNTDYRVQVIATRTTAVATGPPSSPPATATTNAPLPPAQVSTVAAAALSDTEISVSWSAVAFATAYVVEWREDGAYHAANRRAVVSGTSHTITGLEPSTAYFIRVAATRTGAANGPPSFPEATATTNAPLPPAQVSTVAAVALSDTEVYVVWEPVANATAYVVEWREGGAYHAANRRAVVSGTSHTITGLEYSTAYFIRVAATRTGAVNGPPSFPEATATTNVPPTPAQVTGVQASALSDTEISVSWSAAENATAYVVEWREDGESHADDRRAVVAGTEAIIENLEPETEYFIRVFGTREGAANGPASAEDSARTLESAFKSAIKRFPGGNEIAMQLSLVGFAGVLSGFRFRGRKSPQREAMVLGFMCAASMILPIIGIGSLFWTGGIVLIVAAAAGAAHFLMSR